MNEVAAECCGSCKYFYYDKTTNGNCCHYKRATLMYMTSFPHRLCAANYYKPRNPIPIIDIPGVKELVEGVYKEGFKVGYETGDHDKAYPESANAYRTIKFYKYIKSLEDKDE